MIGLAAACALFATAIPCTAEAAKPAATSVGLGGTRLHQVAVTTSDLPRAIRFYRDTLGLRPLFESNGMAFFDLAGTRLMIALDGNRPRSRPAAILYFDAPDFARTRARLVALDVTLEGGVETVQVTTAGALKLQQFVDPDGNALAIMGWVR